MFIPLFMFWVFYIHPFVCERRMSSKHPQWYPSKSFEASTSRECVQCGHHELRQRSVVYVLMGSLRGHSTWVGTLVQLGSIIGLLLGDILGKNPGRQGWSLRFWDLRFSYKISRGDAPFFRGELNFNWGMQSVVFWYYVNMKDVFCQTCCV